MNIYISKIKEAPVLSMDLADCPFGLENHYVSEPIHSGLII